MIKNKWNLKLLCLASFGILASSSLFAAPSLVNGIAFFVNDYPVTLMEVYKIQQRDKVTQQIAIDLLINDRLHKEEIDRRKIVVNDIEIEDEIARIAKQKQATLEQVRNYIQGNGGNWEHYKEEIKHNLQKRKLYQSITQEGLRMVDERELEGYYNTHTQEFSIPQSIDVVKYSSKDAKALEKVVQTNGKAIPQNVQKTNEVLQTIELHPQIVQAFTQGAIGRFTPIFPVSDDFVVFLIQAKNNPALLPYESVRNVVLQKIMEQKEDYLIYEYFEKLRSNAKVNIVRLH
ncbi:peptidylprolyl isomerase [Helicobacter sp. MIT 05-5294]|uniref:peptidylprolyl isomerase n=1 Tax=Helicobacter sp. MIT 05-5294 TaxID=1548150 RepID=UPI000ACA573C|nr:peptidylprolyl isomerase [Helicobacter sp. MIT 05-5294]TLD86992.1 peptidyl-prolyl cis-trans isomerase [Helicobacter sp. MIT 05-5294]